MGVQVCVCIVLKDIMRPVPLYPASQAEAEQQSCSLCIWVDVIYDVRLTLPALASAREQVSRPHVSS